MPDIEYCLKHVLDNVNLWGSQLGPHIAVEKSVHLQERSGA